MTNLCLMQRMGGITKAPLLRVHHDEGSDVVKVFSTDFLSGSSLTFGVAQAGTLETRGIKDYK